MNVEQAIIKLCCLEQNGYIGQGGRLGNQAEKLGGCSIDQMKGTGGLEQGFGSGDGEESQMDFRNLGDGQGEWKGLGSRMKRVALLLK